MLPILTHVPASKLFVSEPNPAWFGNGPNEVGKSNWSNGNWLKSRFHFSFAEYNSRANTNFGALRVMNDDLVQPKRGFGEHGHRDAEIMTYVVEGTLTHVDSMGNKGAVERGGVQYMSAGRGVSHSEFNHGDTPLRFIQCWATPDAPGHKPRYGQCDGDASARTSGQFQHLVGPLGAGGEEAKAPVSVHCDLNLYVAELVPSSATERATGEASSPKDRLTFVLGAGRMAYALCVEAPVSEGSAEGANQRVVRLDASRTGEGTEAVSLAQTVSLARHDAVEVQGHPTALTQLTFIGNPAHILLFEMKQDPRGGRKDL